MRLYNMKTHNIFKNHDLLISDHHSLRALGVAYSNSELFSSETFSALAVPMTQLQARKKIQEIQATMKDALSTLEQWKEYWEEIGFEEEALCLLMRDWDKDQGKIIVRGDLTIIAYGSYEGGEYFPAGLTCVHENLKIEGTQLVSLQNIPVCNKGIQLRFMRDLVSLKGMQKRVHQFLYIVGAASLETLDGIAEEVEGDCCIADNRNLKSLEHLPVYIGGDLRLVRSGDFDYFPDITVKGTVTLDSTQVKLRKVLEERGIQFDVQLIQ